MRKLKLQLDDLTIDTFATTPAEKQKGTVVGEQCTCYTACTCPGCPTCDASCDGYNCGTWQYMGTCEQSCNANDYTCGSPCGYTINMTACNGGNACV